MNPSPHTLRQHLVDLASLSYRAAGRFAYHFARGKLGIDPMFPGLLERGLIPDKARILDLGCGQGLLAAWLLAARQSYVAGEWPAGWAAPGQPADIRGAICCAATFSARKPPSAPRPASSRATCHVDFGQADVVVIMDVLHYVDIPAQDEVLRRVRAALPANGLFITRVGDAGAGLAFRLSNWVDRTVAFFRGNGLPPTHGRPLDEWKRALESLGFHVETAGMNGGQPFANVMLIARLG